MNNVKIIITIVLAIVCFMTPFAIGYSSIGQNYMNHYGLTLNPEGFAVNQLVQMYDYAMRPSVSLMIRDNRFDDFLEGMYKSCVDGEIFKEDFIDKKIVIEKAKKEIINKYMD